MNEDRPAPPAGVHHVAILVRDLAAAEAFYGGLLRLAVLRRWPADPALPAGPERSIWLDAGGGTFLALERAPIAKAASWTAPSGLHLVALRIVREDRAPWERRLAAAGVAIFRRTDYTLYVRDPGRESCGPLPLARPGDRAGELGDG